MKHPEIYLAGLLHGIGLWTDSMQKTRFIPSIINEIEDNYEGIINQASQYALGTGNKPLDKPQNLKSVFRIIQTGDHATENGKDFYFPLKILSIKDDIFPKESESENNFGEHYEDFIKEANNLPNQSLHSYNESLLALLQKYAWCVPVTDYCSLYEYTKLVASFAQCLKIAGLQSEMPFLFFSVELTGIQKFIYNINSNKAARALKGRSFYLNLLIDTVKTKIIHELGLSSAHVVYASGGKFYMLLPNTDDVNTRLGGIEKEIIKQLHDDRTIGDELYVCFGTQAFSPAALNELGDLWKKAGESSSVKKSQKYQHLLTKQFDDFFTPQPNKADVNMKEICALTGLFFEDDADKVDLESLFKHYSTKQEQVNVNENEENRKYVKKSVAEQVKIGRNLQTAKYIMTCIGKIDSQEMEKNEGENEDYAHPLKINVHTLILPEKDVSNEGILEIFPKANETINYKISPLNTYELDLPSRVKDFKPVIEPKFYGGKEQAQHEDGKLKDFEALADGTYLGILRMDVDGLGQIFIKGLKGEHNNFTLYATLSGMLDWFFSGYLNTIRNETKCKKDESKYKYKNHVNILYSGGDDVFAVGKWDVLLDFAEEIRKKFREFVCNREDISISAGIALVGAKFPIFKAADMAGEYEDKAKQFNLSTAYGKDENGIGCKFKTVQKNAICLFGIPVCWEHEWGWVKEMKELLVKWIDKEEQLSKAVLHKIMLFHHLNTKHLKNKSKGKEKDSKQDITWRWHAAYYIGRHRKQSNTEAMAVLEALWMNNEYANNNLGDRAITLLAVAARWAELELRSKEKNV